MEKGKFVFSGKEAKTKEQASESARTSAISNMPLRKRDLNLDDCRYCVKRGFEYGYDFAIKKIKELVIQEIDELYERVKRDILENDKVLIHFETSKREIMAIKKEE